MSSAIVAVRYATDGLVNRRKEVTMRVERPSSIRELGEAPAQGQATVAALLCLSRYAAGLIEGLDSSSAAAVSNETPLASTPIAARITITTATTPATNASAKA